MKTFKNKKDWVKYCEKNFVYKHPDFKDCPKGIIFYGQVGNSNDWYDWFKNMRETEMLIGIFLMFGKMMNYQKILSRLMIIT